MYIVEATSGVNQWSFCLLGSGKTEKEAWNDAFPGGPNKRQKSYAWVREVSLAEFERLSSND